MELLLGAAAAVLGLLAVALFTPLGDRVRSWSTGRFSSSGLAVHVETDPAKIDLSYLTFSDSYFFPGGAFPQSVPNEPGAGWWRWAHDHGAEDAASTTLLVTLQALSDAALIIDVPRLHAEPVDVGAGVLADQGLGGGAPVTPRVYVIDIDGKDPGVHYSDPGSAEPRAPSFTLAKGDTERLLIKVRVDSGAYAWWLELPIVCNGRAGVHRIDDHGEPFTTVGWRGRDGATWSGGRWRQWRA
ncbi:hypothetical protein [Georgenia wangjunii]|uniref:hypothetical protein n=1 Tax=Georgenia wangjunii TaxID=3117730 RepID=UPI002F2652E0